MKLTTGFLGVVIYFSTTRGLWRDKILCKWLIFNGIILLRNIKKKKCLKHNLRHLFYNVLLSVFMAPKVW